MPGCDGYCGDCNDCDYEAGMDHHYRTAPVMPEGTLFRVDPLDGTYDVAVTRRPHAERFRDAHPLAVGEVTT